MEHARCAFNSLSRDHLAKRKKTVVDVYSRFQLPLSGSQTEADVFLDQPRSFSLSTPSLGITAVEERVVELLKALDFQLPLSGSLLWQPDQIENDVTRRLSTPSLGITR